jgi:hypothetical protein
MADNITNLGMSIFEGIVGSQGVCRGWMNDLQVIGGGGGMIKVLHGMAVFPKVKTMYWNEGNVILTAPNGRSLIVVRLDRREGITGVHIRCVGWRRTLERIYNWFTCRYIDIPLAWVECKNGMVVEINDVRQFSALRLDVR